MRKPKAQEPRKDSLGRRFSDARNPTGKNIRLTEGDFLTLQWMYRHGAHGRGMPTPFINRYRELQGITKAHSKFTNRLKDWYHEKYTSANGKTGNLIDRPAQQYRTKNPDNSYRTHAVSNFAVDLLKQKGLLVENAPDKSSSYEHDFLRLCITASIDLACMEEPEKYQFLHHDEVIYEVINSTGKAPVIEYGNKRCNPDAYFGILYKETNSIRLIALEADMMTESLTSKDKSKKTIESMFDLYRPFIRKGLYKEEFGFNGGLFMMVVTVNHTHAQNMVDLGRNDPYFLINWVEGFEYYVTPPKPMPWLFTDAHSRPGNEPFSLTA